MDDFQAPLRLRLDTNTLISNWRWLEGKGGGVPCGAAIKADGYGLGAAQVMQQLAAAGCRDFFVSNWAEALALEPILTDDLSLSVLHGVREEDMASALASRARPTLCTEVQVARWRAAGGGPCDVMVDTGMNRLGLDWRGDVGRVIDGLNVVTLMSHMASADEDTPLNTVQRDRFSVLKGTVIAHRYSLANSAAICLGTDYVYDLTRPGLALYGGVPRAEAAGHIRQVVTPQAQILQRRRVVAGDTIGYNATHLAALDMEVAILNLGYADGYLRRFSGRGSALANAVRLPILGRVSMDLVAIDVSELPDLAEGDWVNIDYALPEAARISGLSQYELLTALGARFDRVWR